MCESPLSLSETDNVTALAVSSLVVWVETLPMTGVSFEPLTVKVNVFAAEYAVPSCAFAVMIE